MQIVVQVETTINAQLQSMADGWGVPRNSIYKVYVANLTSAGPGHAGHCLDLARIIADQVTGEPERTVAVVILPNTGAVGAGATAGAVTLAQRSVMNILEDSAYKLETREAMVIFDDASMYSKSRCAYHPIALAFSNMKLPDQAGFRSKFADSSIYVRRVVPDVQVLQRPDFVLPTAKGQLSVGNLSAAAELKQHITGVGVWTKARAIAEDQCRSVALPGQGDCISEASTQQWHDE
jgi:hypothetical protein